MSLYIIFIILGIIAGIFVIYKTSEDKKDTENIISNIKDFHADEKQVTTGTCVALDKSANTICFVEYKQVYKYKFDEIINCELEIDGQNVYNHSTMGTIGRSITGGLLAGGAGAIIGGATSSSKQQKVVKSISVKVILKDISHPVFKICFLELQTKEGSFSYNFAYNNAVLWHGKITALIEISRAKPVIELVNNQLVADEIIKLKKLLDKKIISEDEFIAQKEKLLK